MERDFLTVEPPPAFEYRSFEPGDPLLYLMPAAQCVDGVLRLTPAAQVQWGDAWRDEPYDLSHGFSTSFEFQIADCDPERGGGDGFTFNIHSYVSTRLVPMDINGTPERFCVQFVTRRDEGRGDPSGNFIRVFFYGELWAVYDMGGPAQVSGTTFNLKDGQPHVVTIEVVEGHKLRVWLGTWKMKRSDLLFERAGTYFDHFERAYVGFTSSTGDAFCRQDILRWSLTAGPAIKPARRPPLVAWWPGNNSREDVVAAHNPVQTEQIDYADGQVGRAFAIGTNSWLEIRPSVLLDVGSSQGFTLEAWVKPAEDAYAEPGGGVIFEWHANALRLGTTASGLYGDITEMDGELTAMHEIVSPNDIIERGVFSYVALTYDRPTGVAKLYCNGGMVREETYGSFCIPTTETLRIGQHPPNRPFRGLIDEPKIYSRALSDEEITANYQTGLAGASTGLTITGVVSDENGEPMRGVTIVLHNLDTSSRSRSGRFQSTDRKGAFKFTDVPAGFNYQVFPLEDTERYRPTVYELPNLHEPQRLSFSRRPELLAAQKSEGDAEPGGDSKK
jgi:hypothetical protein